MNTTNETKRRKQRKRSAWNWSIRQFPMGTYEVMGRQKFYGLILDVIQDWPITDPERAMVAFIAERIWREKYCRAANRDIALEASNGRTCPCGNCFVDSVTEAIRKLEKRGLIKRTKLCQSCGIDSLGYSEEDSCRLEHKQRYEILNVPLRDLLMQR